MCADCVIPRCHFSNKLDREGLDPFELMENVEENLNIACVPMTWPIRWDAILKVSMISSISRSFFTSGGTRSAKQTVIIDDLDSEALDKLIGDSAAEKLREDLELLEVLDPFDEELSLRVSRPPCFLAVRLIILGEGIARRTYVTPPPQSRPTLTRNVEPVEEKFTGFCFKIQANLDKAIMIGWLSCESRQARTKIMKLKHVRLDKMVTVNNATTFLAQDRVVQKKRFLVILLGFIIMEAFESEIPSLKGS